MVVGKTHLRPAGADDTRLIFAWSNDRAVREASLDSQPIPWEEHLRWFRERLSDPGGTRIYIGEDDDGEPFGQIRFEIDEDDPDVARVSLCLDPERRGEGLGRWLIARGSARCFEELSVRAIRAVVKLSNDRSLKAFVAAGFVLLGQKAVRDQRCHILELVAGQSHLARWMRDENAVYIIAEVSANHAGSLDRARGIVAAAAEAGADAVKLQTMTPDAITMDVDNRWFRIADGPWSGRRLHDLYREAQTPWEWHRELFDLAAALGLDCFSTPFAPSAVDFLAELDNPVYKIASFEVVDTPLLARVAATGRPVIMSTGMASAEELDEAVAILRDGGCPWFALLACVSAYPALIEDVRLRNLDLLRERYACPVGLSDHSLGSTAAVAAVARGARLVEKHLTLRRSDGGLDAGFSMEPEEFARLVEDLRRVGRSLANPPELAAGPAEAEHRKLRKSIFAARAIAAGAMITAEDVRVVRPGHGAAPRHLGDIVGARARRDLERGEPVRLEDVEIPRNRG